RASPPVTRGGQFTHPLRSQNRRELCRGHNVHFPPANLIEAVLLRASWYLVYSRQNSSNQMFGNKGEAVLRKPFRALLLLLIVATVATAIKAVFFNFKTRKPSDPPPCWSSDKAKREGVWVCDVSVEPNRFRLDGKTYFLGEAWIEEAFDDDYFLVWFPQRTKLGWNWLCFRVPRYEHGAIELDKFGTTYAGSDFQNVMK